MAITDTADLISISAASKLGVFGLIRAAEEGHEQIVLRHNKPVAAVISMERLEQLHELEVDVADVALATARMLTSGAERHSLDEVLAKFGYTRDQLRDLPD